MHEEIEELRALLAQNNDNLTTLGKARLNVLMSEYDEVSYIDQDENR